MEDYNNPSAERVTLLHELQEVIGSGPLHFGLPVKYATSKHLPSLLNAAANTPRFYVGLLNKLIQ